MTENTTINNGQELSKKENKAAQNKAYYEANKEKIAAYHRAYKKRNSEKIKQKNDVWVKNNSQKIKHYNNNWNKNNPKKRNESNKRCHHKRAATDYLYKAKTALRNAVTYAFKRLGKSKPNKTKDLLGCTWEEAKAHFESLFQEGMSWSNHGEWHIDHIRPVASFGPDKLHLMNHIYNLQPLWAKDNLIKSHTLTWRPERPGAV